MAFRSRQFDARRGRLRSNESLAGWVFADMLLVLFLVGIGTAMTVKAPEPEPEEPEVPVIVSMEEKPVMKDFTVDADGLIVGDKGAKKDTCKQLKKKFEKQLENGDQAAFVLTFAGGDSAGPANRVSEQVNGQLTCAGLKTDAEPRSYWDGRDLSSKRNVRVEIFFYIKQDLASE